MSDEVFQCDICDKQLSRKQRLHTHRLAKHGLQTDVQTSSYKRYKTDLTIPVPRTTLYRQKISKADENNDTSSKHEAQLPSIDFTCDEFQTSETQPEAEEHDSSLSKPEHMEHEPTNNESSSTSEQNTLCFSIQSHVENEEQMIMTMQESSDSFEIVERNETAIQGETCNYSSESDREHIDGYTETSSSDETSETETEEELSSSDSNEETSSDTAVDNNSSSMTKHEEIYTACMAYSSRHCLNAEARTDLMKLLGIATDNNPCEFTSAQNWKKTAEFSYRIVDVCAECSSIFPDDENIVTCVIDGCFGLRFKGGENHQFKRQRNSFFAAADVKSQIKSVIERDETWESVVEYRRKCKTSGDILDILNGELYKHIMSGNHLDDLDENISLIFNTDGVPLYNSSKVSIWPVYLVINELPPKLRFARNNMILWGVWQSKGKPTFRSFFQPFADDMINLKENGLSVDIAGKQKTLKVLLIAGTLDLQAKAMVVDMMHHNGENACITCEIKGEVVRQGKGHARVFSYSEDVPRQRESDEVLQNGLQAQGQKHVKGIKGVSPLLALDWFDIVKGTVPDYMHGALLGVTKAMLKLFFAPANKQKPYYIANRLDDIDTRLMTMKPTDEIPRLPRNLQEHYSQFKASELQSWLLFYCLPCLLGILPTQYFDHLALMVEGMYILLGDCITEEAINRAEGVLKSFYEHYEHLYGKNNVTLNVHNTGMHLASYVRYLGPLWAWSCFPFEDMNGSLLDHLHGTGNVCAQILQTIHAQKEVAVEVQRMPNSNLREFTWKMIRKRRAVRAKSSAANCDIAGAMVRFVPNDDIRQKLEGLLGTQCIGNVYKVLRIMINDQVFFSTEYTRMEKRICYTVLFVNNGEENAGRIQFFLYHQNSNKCIAVVKPLDMGVRLHHEVNHLCKVQERAEAENIHLCYVEQIKEKLLLLCGNENNQCISKLPNRYGQCS